jgi:hypothetical protein
MAEALERATPHLELVAAHPAARVDRNHLVDLASL